MITIDGFELDNTQEFTITKDYVRQRLRDFNEKYFDNRLDINYFPIKLFPYKHSGGSVYFDCSYNRLTGEIYNASINDFRISTSFSFTEEQLCNIILHEMIHVYQIQVLKRQDIKGNKLEPHGQTFTSKMNELNKKGWNIKILMPREGFIGLSKKGEERRQPKYIDLSKETIVLVAYKGCKTEKLDYGKLGKLVAFYITYKNWLLQKDTLNNLFYGVFHPEDFLLLKVIKNLDIEKKDLLDLTKNRFKPFPVSEKSLSDAITKGDIINMDEYKEIDLDESLNKTNDFIKGLQEDPYTEIDVREDGDIISISGIIS